MTGLGCDNTNVNVGKDHGICTQLRKDHCPFVKIQGCTAHLFNLATKHSFEEFRTLEDFDLFIKSVYKFFSKRPKKILDLEKWFILKNKKYYKLLNIFDIRW